MAGYRVAYDLGPDRAIPDPVLLLACGIWYTVYHMPYASRSGIWYTVYQASLASSILYTKAGWYTVYQTHVAAHWLCCAALLPGWLPGCVALSIGRASPAKVQIALSRLEARL